VSPPSSERGRATPRRPILLALALAVITTVGVVAFVALTRSGGEGGGLEGKPAPPISGQTLDGETISRIGAGLCIFVGIRNDDNSLKAVALAEIVQLTGRTRGDQVVAFDGDPALKGELVDVEIVDAKNLTLFGEMLRETVSS